MAKRSNAVAAAIKTCYAKLAAEQFKKAAAHVVWDRPEKAEQAMAFVERWLDKAGADATRWDFRA